MARQALSVHIHRCRGAVGWAEGYVPKTGICGLNVEMFEAYFGYEATGKQETGAGAPQDPVFPSDLLAFPHSHCSVVLTH